MQTYKLVFIIISLKKANILVGAYFTDKHLNTFAIYWEG
jgi:hypothetical protein